MSEIIEPIRPTDARRLDREIRALLSGPKPDRAKAETLLAAFQARLWPDFVKHGDARIRAICAVMDTLRAELAKR